ncbi:TPR Domain containing protein [Trypanosoma rangeli]|uniref:TPR Domain containing protein n=1 Tax=Trypanosoma rangeli TaxID=5698 RepID=A0A422NVH0_TRYRA|nr:TPR Domain containing protein [Trypanosoma rangeli]RNF09456.1 TPR Domain containing protein [Trypanosoma rangeli]|eukprot:RNF09456.1 TPR Domain containing protein [Trypanosoma rangeli]
MTASIRAVRERLSREHFERARALKADTTEQAEEVMRHLSLSINYNPIFVTALLLRGQLAARLGCYDVAVADFSLTIQLEEHGLDRRRLAAMHGARGNVFRRLNKITESILDFMRAVEVEPDNGTWLYELGLAYSLQGNRALAQHFFTSALGEKVTGRMTENVRFRTFISLGTCKLTAGDVNGAEAVLTRGLEIQETAALHNLLGITRFKREEYNMAARNFQRALELDSLNSEYHVNLGVCCFQMGTATDALKHFDGAVLRDPKRAVHHFFRGNTELVLELYPQAIADLNEAIALDASRETHHYSKALAFMGQTRYEEAQQELQKALELNPRFRTAWVHSGLLNFLQGDLFTALDCFTQALELWDADALVHECIGLVYCALKYNDLATESFTRCIRLCPENPVFYFRRGVAMINHGDFHGAYLDLHEAVHQQKFNDAQAFHSLSVVLSRLGRHAESLEYANKAIALSANNYIFLLQRAECLYTMGNYTEVLNDVAHVFELGHESAEVYYLRGRSNYVLHAFQNALEDLLQAAKMQPLLNDSADYCFALGEAYLYSGQNPGAAEVAFTRAITFHPNPPLFFFDERAKARQRLGDAAGTLADLNIVLREDARDPRMLLRRAFANKALRQYDAAAGDFEKAKSMEAVREALMCVSYENFFTIDEIV